MPACLFLLLSVALLTASCSGEDKHLPSSNPPEYDPKKVYSAPSVALPQSAKPTELERLQSKLQSFEPGPNEKGEWKKVPFNSDSLQLFKGVTSHCEALSRLAQGLGSTQLFAGDDGVALKKALGPEAEAIARRLDEQLAEGLKHSLGSSAADCPISVRPQKKSGLSQPARLVRTRVSSSQPLLFAQTTVPDTSQDDDEVNKPPTRREDAPPDWVGYKTTETMARIGKKPHTEGIREQYEMVIAPKAKRCPVLAGPNLEGMVEGTFEWSFMMYRATSGPDGEPQGVLYRLHVVAEILKGKVGDDAKVQYVDFDVRISLQHIGTELAPYSHSYGSEGRFTIDQRTMGIPQELKIITVSGFSEGEAQIKDAQLLGTLTALVAYFSGQEYYNAQTIWSNPNTCVEMTFTPATKTKKFVPNESTPVKAELRTKKEQKVVPAKFKEAKERPRERTGTVSLREAQSQPDTPATFTYKAPPTRVRHSGFRVKAVSRAGVAEAKEGEWELAPSAYVLEFKSHIVQSPLNFVNSQFGMGLSSNGFDAHVQATVPLQHTDGRGWVGEGVMQYETRTTAQPAQCEIRIQGTGTTTFHVKGGSISSDPDPFAVNVIILPGRSGEVAEPHCSSANTPEKLKELLATQGVQGGEAHGVTKAGGWSAAFNVTRFTTFNMNKGGYEIGGWTPVRDSDVIAKKTITVNCGIGPNACQEETTLILRLADEPGAAASQPK